MKSGIRLAVSAACLVVLTACGGGGGGGSAPEITLDRSSLTFVGFTRSLPAPENLTLTLVSGGGSYYGRIVLDAGGIFDVAFVPTSSNSAVVTVAPIASAGVSRSGEITLELCGDVACKDVVWSRAVPYSLTIFDVDASGVTLVGYEGAAATSRALAVSPPDTGGQLAVAAAEEEGAGWLTAARPSAAAVEVGASGEGLVAGSYHGTVTLSIAGQVGGPSLSIPVAFTVGTGLVAPPAASRDLTLGSVAASLEGTAAVAFNGGQSRAWSAESDRPWLKLTTSAGDGPGTLAWRVDTSELQGVANWSSATAQVTIHSAGLSDVSLPVTLALKLPEVTIVSPGTVAAGAPATVRVKGRGLLQLAGAAQISVGGTPASGAVLSDTEAAVELPALAAGRRTVAISNAVGAPAWSGAVTVAARSSLAYATAANPGEKRSAVYDPSREAVFAVNRAQNTLVRFRRSGAAWQVDGLVVTGIGDLAMAPDRSRLYVGSAPSLLLEIDPDTLAVVATHEVPASLGATLETGWGSSYGMPVTDNLRLWFGSGQWSPMAYYDLRGERFGKLAIEGINGTLYSPRFYAAGDGSRLFVAQTVLSPPLPDYVYLPATDAFTDQANVPVLYDHATFDEGGARVLVDDVDLYRSSDFALLGTVQTPSTAIGTTALLSPDGTRIYRLVTQSRNTLVIDHIDVLDATQVVPGTSQLVTLGQIAVTDQAVSCGSSPDYGCDVRGVFLISPLGDTLFWVGNQRLVVIPIPDALSGAAAAQPQLRLRAATR